MSEKFRENFCKKTAESAGRVEEFNRETEKRYRQEVRKMLGESLSEALKDSGFKKTGYSLWSRKIGDSWHILYLQRSQWSHRYYIEVGICNEKDIPKGKKLDIVFCEKRERIERIVADIERERIGEAENTEKEIRKKADDVNMALGFEASGASEKYPEEYFVPSVSPREAKEKIAKITESVKEYMPLWFNK